jgi:hypothetical protein
MIIVTKSHETNSPVERQKNGLKHSYLLFFYKRIIFNTLVFKIKNLPIMLINFDLII